MGGASTAWLLLLAACYWQRVDSFPNTAIIATSNTPLIRNNSPPSLSPHPTVPSLVSSKSTEPASLSPSSNILPLFSLSSKSHSFYPSNTVSLVSSTTPLVPATPPSSSLSSVPSFSPVQSLSPSSSILPPSTPSRKRRSTNPSTTVSSVTPTIPPSSTPSSTSSFGSSSTTSSLSTTPFSPSTSPSRLSTTTSSSSFSPSSASSSSSSSSSSSTTASFTQLNTSSTANATSSPSTTTSSSPSNTSSSGSSTPTPSPSTSTSSPSTPAFSPSTSTSSPSTSTSSPSTSTSTPSTSTSSSSTSISSPSTSTPSPSILISSPFTLTSSSSTSISSPSTSTSSPSTSTSSPSTSTSSPSTLTSSPSTLTSSPSTSTSSPSTSPTSPSNTSSSGSSTSTSSPSNTTSSNTTTSTSSPSSTAFSSLPTSPSSTSSSGSSTSTSSPFNTTSSNLSTSPSSTSSSGSSTSTPSPSNTTSPSPPTSTSSSASTSSSGSSTTSSSPSITPSIRGRIHLIALVPILLVLVLGVAAAYIFYTRRYKPVRHAESIELPLVVPPQPDVSVERLILLSELSATVENLFAQGHIGISREYAELKSVCTPKQCRVAKLSVNKNKNRYINILPYDDTRVILKEYPLIPGSDFINASYIHGHSLAREFIACQGPLTTTVSDFWRMVWEKKVHVIVMVTQCVEGNKEKCSKYWPDIGQSLSFMDRSMKVKNLQEQEHHQKGFVYRKLQLCKRRNLRLVHHFHFISWPDMGCPAMPDQLINFVKTVKTTTPKESSHIVVHCSAGVGRTGTFIALNNLMEEIHEQSSVDVFHAVYRMRLNRTNMVQTEAQYAFLYKCVLKYYLEQTGQDYRWSAIKRSLSMKADVPDVITVALKGSVQDDSTAEDLISFNEEEEEEEEKEEEGMAKV